MTTPEFDLYWTFPDPHERAELVAIKRFGDSLLSPVDSSKRAFFGSSDLAEITAAMVRREWTIESFVLIDASGAILDDVRIQAYSSVLADDFSHSAQAVGHTLSTELRSVYIHAVVITCGHAKLAFGRRGLTTTNPTLFIPAVTEFCTVVTDLTRLANRPRPVPVPKPFPYPALSPFWLKMFSRAA